MENLQAAFKLIAIAILAIILMAWPVQLLWNAFLVPAVEGIHAITFWQALGIQLLATLLFKNSNISKND